MSTEAPKTDFIRQKVREDNARGTWGGRVVTRFPPEPNGWPHIGHAKSICLNFGLAAEFGGVCNLRYDDTNPDTEDQTYVDAILRDLRWLGFEPGERIYFASDYYEAFYEAAVKLVTKGAAYVCDLDEEQISVWRGTVTEPGRESPGRTRSVEENLDLLARMRAGEFPDGACTLRARIDMAHPNMKMRDPLLYRIKHAHHYRQGDRWCIYPMYDFAHPISDAIEGITHSICTLEFENNRDIYDWLMRELEVPTPPQQTEFARLAVAGFVTSKRKLLRLVEAGKVDGWDDPRVPTLAGLRRRGVTPSALRSFSDRVGVSKANSTVEPALLDDTIRDDLNTVAPRVLCVVSPLKVVLTNWPEGHTEWLDAPLFPHDVGKEGSRRLPVGRELWIDRDDFMEDPPKDFHRLAPGREVRLRHAFVIRCEEVVKDAAGRVTELRCTWDPDTRSGSPGAGRKVKGTLHWVDAAHALDCEVRRYERLFLVDTPGVERDLFEDLNPDSCRVFAGAKVEPSVAADPPETRYQFERVGYYWRDPVIGRGPRPVFNCIVGLKDSWANKVSAAAPRPEAAPPPAPPERRAPARPAVPELDAAGQARAQGWALRGVADADARRIAADGALAALLDDTLAAGADPAAAARWIVNDVTAQLAGRTPAETKLDGAGLAGLVGLLGAGRLTVAGARRLLGALLTEGGDPAALVQSLGLGALDDAAALGPVVAEVLAANPAQVAGYRAGKTQLLGFFVGQVMKATQGRAAPERVNEAVKAALG